MLLEVKCLQNASFFGDWFRLVSPIDRISHLESLFSLLVLIKCVISTHCRSKLKIGEPVFKLYYIKGFEMLRD